MDKHFHVYILASKSGVLYTGMTNNLTRRFFEHWRRRAPSFTQKYGVNRLVWFEAHGPAYSAISREKEIKGWRRSKKIALINAANPHWQDLSYLLL